MQMSSHKYGNNKVTQTNKNCDLLFHILFPLKLSYIYNIFCRSINTLGMEDANVHLSRMSQFILSLPSVSDVRNYLNVRSGYITFSPPKINII
jgi:hypothetical protein